MSGVATEAAALTGGFDYGSVGPSVAAEARKAVARIRDRHQSFILDSGRDLLAIKARMEHGTFTTWVGAELGITPRTAQNYMRAAEALGSKSEIVSLLPPTAVYALTAAATPEAFRSSIVERIEGGERIAPAAIVAAVKDAQRDAKEVERLAKLSPEERKSLTTKQQREAAKRKRWQDEHHERRRADLLNDLQRYEMVAPVAQTVLGKLSVEDRAVLESALATGSGAMLIEEMKDVLGGGPGRRLGSSVVRVRTLSERMAAVRSWRDAGCPPADPTAIEVGRWDQVSGCRL